MQPEEGVDLEQYAKPVAKKKEKPAWLKKGARVVAATGIALGGLAATHLEASANGPDPTPVPITKTVEGPKPVPTLTPKELQLQKDIIENIDKQAQEKQKAEVPTQIPENRPITATTPLEGRPQPFPPKPEGVPGTPQNTNMLWEFGSSIGKVVLSMAVLWGLAWLTVSRLVKPGFKKFIGDPIIDRFFGGAKRKRDRREAENRQKAMDDAALIRANREIELDRRRRTRAAAPPPGATPTP